MANNDYNENYYEDENPEINDIEGEAYPEVEEEPVSLFSGTGGMGLGNIFKGGRGKKSRPQEEAPRAGKVSSRAAYREEDYERRGAGYDDDATGFSASELRDTRQHREYREETVKPAREFNDNPFDQPVHQGNGASVVKPAASPYVSPAKPAAAAPANMVVFYPRAFDDSIRDNVAAAFLKRSIVCVDFTDSDSTVQMRVLDFLSGVLYAVNGNHFCPNEKVHFFLPQGVTFEEGTLGGGSGEGSGSDYSPSKSAVDTRTFL